MNNNNPEKSNKLSRYKLREQIFILCFEKLFNDYSFDDIFENTFDSRDIQLDQQVMETAADVEEKKEQLDGEIGKYLKKGWKVNRLSKVAHSILRLAVYEILFSDNIPVSVSINEAVELAKKYSTPEDAAFINGVLGSFVKETKQANGEA